MYVPWWSSRYSSPTHVHSLLASRDSRELKNSWGSESLTLRKFRNCQRQTTLFPRQGLLWYRSCCCCLWFVYYLLFVYLLLPRTTIYVLHSLQHFKHILSIIKQKKGNQYGSFSCQIKAICTSHRGYKRHPSYTPAQLRLMGSVSKTLKRSMRTEHLRRTASAISVAVKQHAGMNLSFVFQLSYCLYNLTTHRRHNFSSL